MLTLKRTFVDVEHFEEKLGNANAFVEAIDWLYSKKASSFCLNGKIDLADFMTLLFEIVTIALNSHFPDRSIQELVDKLGTGKEKYDFELNSNIIKYDRYCTEPDMKFDTPVVSFSHMDGWVVQSVLWAAYVYCKVYSEMQENDNKKGLTALLSTMYNYSVYDAYEKFKKEHVLMKKTKETILAFISKIPTESHAADNNVSERKTTDEENAEIIMLREELRKKTEECENLCIRLSEYEEKEFFKYVAKGKTVKERESITRDIKDICSTQTMAKIRDKLIVKMKNKDIDIVNKDITARDLFLELGRMGMPILEKGFLFQGFQANYTQIRDAAKRDNI